MRYAFRAREMCEMDVLRRRGKCVVDGTHFIGYWGERESISCAVMKKLLHVLFKLIMRGGLYTFLVLM